MDNKIETFICFLWYLSQEIYFLIDSILGFGTIPVVFWKLGTFNCFAIFFMQKKKVSTYC